MRELKEAAKISRCIVRFGVSRVNGPAALTPASESIFTFLRTQPNLAAHKPRRPTMNAPNSEIRRASTVFLAALFLVSGCSRKKEAQPGPTAAKPQPVRPAMASAEKTSFQEVTSQLEPGGNLFAYFGTEQWIRGASEQVSSWRGILQVAPVLTDDQRAEANKGFDLATRLIRNSGLEEISGVGMSGIATEKGRYRTKLLVHHYPDRKSGYLWSLFGAAPHALDGLNQLPTTTALSVFFGLDLRGLWAILQRELSASGIAGLDEWSRGFPKEFEAKTGINFEALLNS